MKRSPHKRNNEVQAARGRLRGALNESLQNQEDDISEDYEEEEEQPIITHRQRGRPKKIPVPDRTSPIAEYLTPSKRRKRENTASSSGQKIQAESFVMKLFDRSLDLSKYSEQTSLYPICRAWMANQPRNPSIRSYRDTQSPTPFERKDNGQEIIYKLRKGELRDVTTMPKSKKSDLPKIPIPRTQPKKYCESEELFVDNELMYGNREDILAHHLDKWKGVKSNWQKQTKIYQQSRYDVSFQLLDTLFKP